MRAVLLFPIGPACPGAARAEALCALEAEARTGTDAQARIDPRDGQRDLEGGGGRDAHVAGAGLPSGGRHVRDTLFAGWPAMAAGIAAGDLR